MVDDNYHYMDEDARRSGGSFDTYEEALARGERVDDRFLARPTARSGSGVLGESRLSACPLDSFAQVRNALIGPLARLQGFRRERPRAGELREDEAFRTGFKGFDNTRGILVGRDAKQRD